MKTERSNLTVWQVMSILRMYPCSESEILWCVERAKSEALCRMSDDTVLLFDKVKRCFTLITENEGLRRYLL